MIAHAHPGFKVPGTSSLQPMLHDAIQAKRIALIEYIHQNVGQGAITADCWTTADRRRFFGATLHFVTPDYQMASLVIGIERVRSSQTLESLLRPLKNAVDIWGLNGKLICGTTNQGTDVKKAIPLLQLQENVNTRWITCFFDKIHLSINQALEESAGATAIVEKCRQISAFFRDSSVAMAILDKEQDRLHKQRYKLRSVSSTGWNSSYAMAMRVLQIWEAIAATHNTMSGSRLADERSMAKDLGQLLLSEQELTTLREIISVLKLSVDFTQWAGNTSNLTVSQIYPRILEMISAPNPYVTEEARVFRQNLDSGLTASWLLDDIPTIIILAMYFNPASASSRVLDQLTTASGTTLRKQAEKYAKEAIIAYLTERSLLLEEDSELDTARMTTQDSRQEYNVKSDSMKMGQFSITADYAVDLYSLIVSSHPDPVDCAQYKDCPLDYWASASERFPLSVLGVVVRPYLCIQASSSSKAGQVRSQSRTTPSDNNFRNIILFSSFEEAAKTIGY